MIRITGGQSKGRKISLKKVSSKKATGFLRPTSAKVRKAIFDIIGERIGGSIFLDLYAGTGAVGIEALSRGASYSVFVEEDSKRVSAIKGLLNSFGFSDRANVVKEKVLSFIKGYKGGIIFDIIFADPPYESEEINELLLLIDNKDLIAEGGILVVEHSSKKFFLLPQKGRLRFKKRYKYGDTALSLFFKEKVRSGVS